MRPIKPRPTFAATFAKALSIAAKKRGWRAYLPARLSLCFGVAFIPAYLVPTSFWSDAKWDISTAVYGSVLAFNALLLAIGWGAFSKIYEIIGSRRFGDFLGRHDMLDIHILFVGMVHAALAVSALASLAGLITLTIDFPVAADRIIFGTMIALSINSTAEAMRASDMMHDLLWDKIQSEFEHDSGRNGPTAVPKRVA